MINHVSFQGRFVKDLELSYSTSKKPYVKFTIVWNEKGINNSENTCFLNCVAFNSLATNAAKFFKKGKMAVVEGKLMTSSYKDKKGDIKSSIELIADKIHFCDDKPSSYKDEEDEEDEGVTPFD